MPNLDPTFSIVVPTHRRPEELRATLTAILAFEYAPERYEVIVVDDGGDESTREIVDAVSDGRIALTLETQRQRGAASARNRGAQLASGQLILFCDDDIIPEPSHLRLLLEARARHGDALLAGAWEFAPRVVAIMQASAFGRYRIALERHFQESAEQEPLADDPACVRMSLLSSANLALTREMFWQIGGFDESFPLAGAEDQDFSLRARRAGAELLLDTRIRCLHNDNRISLRAYCAREERNAQTVAWLARKYPSDWVDTPYVRENRPVRRDDPPSLIAKKGVKAVLASAPVLGVLQRLADLFELMPPPAVVLERFYSAMMGLYLYRGFRRGWVQ